MAKEVWEPKIMACSLNYNTKESEMEQYQERQESFYHNHHATENCILDVWGLNDGVKRTRINNLLQH